MFIGVSRTKEVEDKLNYFFEFLMEEFHEFKANRLEKEINH